MVTITNELLEAARSLKGGWSKRQLELLGVSWPPRRGWRKRIVGTQIGDMAAMEFLELGPEPGAFHIEFNAAPVPQPPSRVARLIAEGKPLSEIEYPD